MGLAKAAAEPEKAGKVMEGSLGKEQGAPADVGLGYAWEGGFP